MPGILRFQPERRERIRHDIRGRCQVFPGCRRQVHDTLNAAQHIPRFPAGHGHVVHRLRRLSRRKLGLGTHLPGLAPEIVKILPRCPGHRRNHAHGGIKICRRLHSCSSKPGHHSRHRKQLLPHGRNLVSNRLQLLPGSPDFLQSNRRLFRLLFQTPQPLLCLNDFPLQGIILILGNVPVRQSLLRLLRSSFQRFQLLLRLRNRILQKPLLLNQQFRIPRIQL